MGRPPGLWRAEAQRIAELDVEAKRGRPYRSGGAADSPDEYGERCRGEPDPPELAGQDERATAREQPCDPERGDLDRLEGEEEAAVVEGRQQGHPQAAVGQHVEEAVRDR